MHYNSSSISEGNLSRNVEAPNEAAAMEECLASRHTFSYLSYIAQAHLPRDGPTLSGLGPSTLIIKNYHINMPIGQLMGAVLQLRFPLSSRV